MRKTPKIPKTSKISKISKTPKQFLKYGEKVIGCNRYVMLDEASWSEAHDKSIHGYEKTVYVDGDNLDYFFKLKKSEVKDVFLLGFQVLSSDITIFVNDNKIDSNHKKTVICPVLVSGVLLSHGKSGLENKYEIEYKVDDLRILYEADHDNHEKVRKEFILGEINIYRKLIEKGVLGSS